MVEVHPEYIVDGKSNRKAVVIPYSKWKEIMEEMEDLEDIRAYDAAKAESDEVIPFDQAIKEIENGKLK